MTDFNLIDNRDFVAIVNSMGWKIFLLLAGAILSVFPLKAAEIITKLGDVMAVGVPAYALGLSMSESDWNGTKQFAFSYAGAQITVSGLQKAIARRRPNGMANGFPSGHASSAFSGAMFIHRRYGWRRALIPYMLSAFTGFSRIQSRWHYLDDVVGGAVIAGIWTWMIVDEKTPMVLSIGPNGVQLDFNFLF